MCVREHVCPTERCCLPSPPTPSLLPSPLPSLSNPPPFLLFSPPPLFSYLLNIFLQKGLEDTSGSLCTFTVMGSENLLVRTSARRHVYETPHLSSRDIMEEQPQLTL